MKGYTGISWMARYGMRPLAQMVRNSSEAPLSMERSAHLMGNCELELPLQWIGVMIPVFSPLFSQLFGYIWGILRILLEFLQEEYPTNQ